MLHGNIHNHATAVFLFPFLSLADIAFEEFGFFKDMYELPELHIRQLAIIDTQPLARRYNSTDEDNWETLNEILKELVLNRGEGTFFQAPVYFDYGCFTTFGKNCGANFNFTVLDCAPVKIGDNVMFGPNCTLAAPMHPLCPKERNVRTRENGELYNLEYARGNADA